MKINENSSMSQSHFRSHDIIFSAIFSSMWKIEPAIYETADIPRHQFKYSQHASLTDLVENQIKEFFRETSR